jgi:hypothetical protein
VRSIFALFDKPKAVATLAASCRAEHAPASGLLPVELALSSEPRTPLTLRIRLAGHKAALFEKSFPDGAGAVHVIIHGHLLPNGPVQVTLEALAGRAVLAERTLTLQIRNEGAVAEQVRASLKASGVPVVTEGPCDSGWYDYADASLTAWYDRSPAEVEAHLAALAASGAVSADEIEALRHFAENGYLVMPGAVSPEHLDRLNGALDDAVARKVEGYEWGSSQRMHNLHVDYPAIRELWTHPRIMRMLELIFGVPANPCQSLTYVFGSQQEHHQDTVHLTPFPAGRMCGVWTALEDVQPQSGELVVFPKSHRLPRVYMDTVGVPKVTDNEWAEFGARVVPYWTDLIVKNRLERVIYQPTAGTVLIWHENLMHAGSPRKDMDKSRRSIVGHYFAQGAIVYYDSSGQPGSVHEPA